MFQLELLDAGVGDLGGGTEWRVIARGAIAVDWAGKCKQKRSILSDCAHIHKTIVKVFVQRDFYCSRRGGCVRYLTPLHLSLDSILLGSLVAPNT